MRIITLNNKKQIPTIGLGTWGLDKENVTDIVKEAIVQKKYRHIDCASIYKNEKEIGYALKNILASTQTSRKELFITSKLWNTDHHPDNVENACRQTLSDLQLEYLDLYLVHWGIAFAHGKDLEPMGSNGLAVTEPVPILQTWRAMENLVEKKLVKSIGVANFTAPMIVDLLSYATIKPVMNQIEIHPYNSQVELVDYCHKKGIHVTAYSPLGSSEKTERKPLNDSAVTQLSKEYTKTPAQILIRWLLQKGLIAIPKSSQTGHIAENIDVYDFTLTSKDVNQLNVLNRNYRFVDPSQWWGVPYFK